MRKTVLDVIKRHYPELNSKRMFPLPGVVSGIPDPPSSDGANCSLQRPRYAVNVQVLTPQLETDEEMPELEAVPVVMTGAAGNRGVAALPQTGTIVMISFLGGSQSKPVVSGVLPYFQSLPVSDGTSMRWQQTATSYQEVDATGNWNRITDQNINDTADLNINRTAKQAITDMAELAIKIQSAKENIALAPKTWLGSENENVLAIISEFMTACISAFNTLASHTHPNVGTISQGSAVSTQSSNISGQKSRLDSITKS